MDNIELNGVDIENCSDTGGGYNVGWFDTSEWLEYTVNVGISDNYDFFPRVASINSNAQLKLSVDGVAVTGNLAVPNTGNWQTFQTMHIRNISLTAGQHVIKWEAVTGGFNFNSWAAWQSSTSSSRTSNLDLLKEINLYPNPITNKEVKIRVPDSLEGKTLVEVIDLQGRVLKTEDFEGNQHSMDVNGLSNGIYIFRISSSNQNLVKKIIIK